MELLHSFSIKAWHSPSAIARIALVLSRRRLRAEEINVAIADDPGFDDIEVQVRACDAVAERLRHQFARVVEVVAVRHTEGVPADRPRERPLDVTFAAGD